MYVGLILYLKIIIAMETVSLNPESLRQWQEQDMEIIRYGYELYPDDTVLDIGSYQREWGNKIAADHGCHVEYFDALDNRAAWLFDGELKMGGAYYYTSMFTPGWQTYHCVDIAPFLQAEVALVKINIEGGEYDLLNYIIEKGLMKNIINLQVQFHLIEGVDCEGAYKELAKQLSLTHKISWRYPFCWESWERI
jgi:hypothetical protein